MKKEQLKKWQLGTIIYGVIFYLISAFTLNDSADLVEKLFSPKTLVPTFIATLVYTSSMYAFYQLKKKD